MESNYIKALSMTMIVLLAAITLAGCDKAHDLLPQQTDEPSANVAPETITPVSAQKHEYSDADTDSSYDESTAITVDLSKITAAEYSIDVGGTYVISGSFDGMLSIAASDEDNVQLVLSDAHISCANSPAIYATSTNKLIITLAGGTQNTISDGSFYTVDEEGADGAIYCKSDLSINGSGTLDVSGNTAHGIVTNDDFVMTEGIVNITAVKDGIRGKDSVCIKNGTLTVNAGSDGIISTNDTDTDRGYVIIDGGTINIHSTTDGIQAVSALTVNGGNINVKTGDGSADLVLKSDANGGNGFFPGNNDSSTAAENTAIGGKGIKCDGNICLACGSITVDSVDDAIHANGDITLEDVTLALATGDDAVHSDGNVVISGGISTITKCYEGIEGFTVTIDGGTLDIVASDDGFNSAGGTDNSGFGGFMGNDAFAATEGCFVIINGGTITVQSEGDCIDSNGDLIINGGTLNLNCGGNGNSALDCNGTYSNNGGSITTNDGSENNVGGIGGKGGMGGMGGMGGKGGMGKRP